MAAPETEVIGVNARAITGHEWDITAVDTGTDTFVIDISEFFQDITNVLSVGDGIVVENRLSNRENLTVSGVTDNGDGTADIVVQETLTSSTVGGYLAYRLQVPGETDAELTKNFGLIEALDKDTGLWGDDIDGRREWDLSLDVLHTESNGDHEAPFNDTVKLEVDVGNTTYKASGLEELSMTLTAETEETSSFEDAKWRYLIVTGFGMEISTSGNYYDPNSSKGEFYDKVKQEAQAGNSITFTLTFAGLQFTGELRASDWTITAPADNTKATFDWTYTESGEVSFSGTIDTGLDLLISAFFNRDLVHTLMEKTMDDGTRQSGATRYSGEALIEELSFEASTDEALTHSYSFMGDGPLDEMDQE